MYKKVKQGTNRVFVVKTTTKILNKSIDFFEKMCYDKNSRETNTKTKKSKGKIMKKKRKP